MTKSFSGVRSEINQHRRIPEVPHAEYQKIVPGADECDAECTQLALCHCHEMGHVSQSHFLYSRLLSGRIIIQHIMPPKAPPKQCPLMWVSEKVSLLNQCWRKRKKIHLLSLRRAGGRQRFLALRSSRRQKGRGGSVVIVFLVFIFILGDARKGKMSH